MRILFVTNNFTPYSGGVVSSIKTTVCGLQNAGHEVRIITLDFLGADHQDPTHVMRLSSPIKFKYKTNYMAIPWRPYAQIYEFCELWKPDIIHVHHPFLLGNSAVCIAQKLHIPVVFTYHTLYEAYAHYVPFFTGVTRLLTKKVVNKFCTNVQGIIVPSQPIAENLQQQNIPTPFTIIPSPLDDLFFQKKPGVKTRNKQFQLLVVSRFAKEKNIPFLLDIMTQLPHQFFLTLVGYGPEYETLQKYAYEKLQLSPIQIRFIHKPSKEDLLKYYQSADLFLFSSQTDTQGLVLAEAMACGVPVIALDGPGQRDIVHNGYNGFIVHCAEEMYEKIIEISQNYSVHEQLQIGAWQTAQKYRSQDIVKKMLNFYNQTLQSKSL